jgi:hypothetical protein
MVGAVGYERGVTVFLKDIHWQKRLSATSYKVRGEACT